MRPSARGQVVEPRVDPLEFGLGHREFGPGRRELGLDGLAWAAWTLNRWRGGGPGGRRRAANSALSGLWKISSSHMRCPGNSRRRRTESRRKDRTELGEEAEEALRRHVVSIWRL
ncbi:hypothetical protein Egran_04811 [Elaphomyces granulatus]|uniref:Uncharacterized protein n=1 Tax=Elaphomyces granulatus TaxID=519963 RepID=A0A232LTE2_9EURO|nr:hypothetical protein Egran_04811 [Elaphomyces granulatus]